VIELEGMTSFVASSFEGSVALSACAYIVEKHENMSTSLRILAGHVVAVLKERGDGGDQQL